MEKFKKPRDLPRLLTREAKRHMKKVHKTKGKPKFKDWWGFKLSPEEMKKLRKMNNKFDRELAERNNKKDLEDVKKVHKEKGKTPMEKHRKYYENRWLKETYAVRRLMGIKTKGRPKR